MNGLLLATIVLFLVLLVGCAGRQTRACRPGLIESIPASRPTWVDDPSGRIPGSDYQVFVGFSDAEWTQSAARRGALRDARSKITRYLGTEFTERLWSTKRDRNRSLGERTTQSLYQASDGFLSRLRPLKWYTRKLCLRSTNRPARLAWQSYVRVKIPRRVIQRQLEPPALDVSSAPRVRVDSTNPNGRLLAQKILGQLTRFNLAVNPGGSDGDKDALFVIRTRIHEVKGVRLGSWYSRVCWYKIDLTWQPDGGDSVLVKRLSGRGQGIGPSRRAAVEDVMGNIARKHRHTIRRSLLRVEEG